MIHAPAGAGSVEKEAIRSHDDLATPFERLLWGPESLTAARLVDRLARPSLGDVELLTKLDDRRALPGRAYQCPSARCFSIWKSMAWSATNCFNRRFSSWRALSRFASSDFIPPRRSKAGHNDLDIFVYVKDVLDRLLAGEAKYDMLRPDVWKQSHPEAIRITGSRSGRPEPTRRPSSEPGGGSPTGVDSAPTTFIRAADPMAVVGAHLRVGDVGDGSGRGGRGRERAGLPLPPSRVECTCAHVLCHAPGARMVASIAADLCRSRAALRLGRTRAGPRRPRRLPGVGQTSCPRSTSTRCEAGAASRLMPGRGEGLLPARKTDDSEGCRGLAIPATTGPAGTYQRPARARTRLTDRKTVAELPLTGLSLYTLRLNYDATLMTVGKVSHCGPKRQKTPATARRWRKGRLFCAKMPKPRTQGGNSAFRVIKPDQNTIF